MVDTKYFTEQTIVAETVQDEKKPGKTKKVNRIHVRNFETTRGGKYIKIVIKGENAPIMVKWSELLTLENKSVNASMLVEGAKFKLKDGRELDPLTKDQAEDLYSVRLRYNKTDAKFGDNTYLRLQSGEYVSENSAVKPKSYKFVDPAEKDFDAYLVRKHTASGWKEFVVSKSQYDDSKPLPENVFKIKRCLNKDAEVIQTTSRNKDEEYCTVLRAYDETQKKYADFIKDKEKIHNEANEAAMNSYVHGDYDLDLVEDDGKLFAVAGNARYLKTDTYSHVNYADDNFNYRTISTRGLVLKDGKYVAGPKYDYGQAVAKSYAFWGKSVGYGFGIAAMSGFLIPVVGPVLASAYAVGVIASAPLIPLVNLGIAAWKNRKGLLGLKSQTELNRLETKKQINSELQAIFELAANKDFAKMTTTELDDRMSKITDLAIELAETTANDGFDADGNVINNQNAHVSIQFKKEYNEQKAIIADLDKTINETKKSIETFEKKYSINGQFDYDKLSPEKQAEYDKLKLFVSKNEEKKKDALEKIAEIKQRSKLASRHDADTEMEQNMKKVDFAKAVLMLKLYPEEQWVKAILSQAGLTNKEIKKLQNLEYSEIKKIEKFIGKEDAQTKKPSLWQKLAKAAKLVQENGNFTRSADVKPQERIVVDDTHIEDTPETEVETEVGTETEVTVENEVDNQEELERLRKEIEDLKNELKRATKKGEKDKTKLEELLKTRNEEIKNLVAKIKDLNQQILDKTKKLEELQAKYDNSKKKTQKALKEIENLTKEIEDLKKQQQDLLDELKSKDADIAKWVTKVNEYDAKVAELNKKIEDTNKTINELAQQIGGLTAENSDLRRDLTDARNRARELENQNREQSTLIDTMVEQYQVKSTTIGELAKEITTEIKQIKNTIKELEKARESLNERKNNNEDAKTLNSAILAHNEAVTNLEKQIEDLLEKNASLNSQATDLMSVLKPVETDATKAIAENVGKIIAKVPKNETNIKKLSTNGLRVDTVKVERKKKEKEYNTEIVSEDVLVKLLKAKSESKKRKALIDYIKQNSTYKNITEADIQKAIELIDSKTLAGESAVKGSKGKVRAILTLGQTYLTNYAQDIKIRTTNPEDLGV